MRLGFLSLCLLSFIAGCHSSAATGKPVILILKMDGQPTAGLSVQLISADGKAMAIATTDDKGRASLLQADGKDVPLGSYKIVLFDAGEAEENPMEPSKKSKNRVPTIYTKPGTTTASVTITDGSQEYSVELKSKS